MTKTIRREILIPQPLEQVWRGLTDSTTLAEWMFPNDFEPHVGHHFTFQVPPNPKVGFDGLVVHCEVLECEPPSRLAFSWLAGGLVGTQVSFRLEPDLEGDTCPLRALGLRRLPAVGRSGISGRRVRLGEDARAASRRGRAPCGRPQLRAPPNKVLRLRGRHDGFSRHHVPCSRPGK
jgi:uncharacterized protein YndB with AHSA1/START domain